ncbi:MAG TPA: GNAT family N-acetyltransferase [Trichormus sp.]|jgi:ribosomal-protein-alanine N-acetyltransferase
MTNVDDATIAAGYARLETERFLLRAFTEDDLDDLAALYGDPVVMRYYPKTYSREETQEFLARIINGYSQVGHHLLAMIYKPNGQFIGRCGIVRQNIEDESIPEIGYMLNKDYWGMGLATEAARKLRDFGFSAFQFERIVSLVRPINTPSQAVARRNGMKIIRDVTYASLDHHLFCITRQEWLAMQDAKAD